MTDEQFEKMYAVELAKLAMLNGIMNSVHALARKHSDGAVLYNWKDLSKLLASAIPSAEQKQPG